VNPKCWMGTRFPYWEGPIGFSGSHSGVGYLEMTGY
jgi:predicted secreted hydrolase